MSSSSISGSLNDKYGPQFAIDSCYHDATESKYFLSKHEDFPWFQWMVATNNQTNKQLWLTEVIIEIPKHCCGYETSEKRMLEERFEVRAGLGKIPSSFRGPIQKNQVCDSYRPDNPNIVKGKYAKFVFACNFNQDFIKATYVTIQILGTSVLAISEVEARYNLKGQKAPTRKFSY